MRCPRRTWAKTAARPWLIERAIWVRADILKGAFGRPDITGIGTRAGPWMADTLYEAATLWTEPKVSDSVYICITNDRFVCFLQLMVTHDSSGEDRPELCGTLDSNFVLHISPDITNSVVYK